MKVDESRLRVGSKIKITSDTLCVYVKIGDVGVLRNDSHFHENGELKDSEGWYWADFKHLEHSNICFAKTTDCFKVLKY